MHKTISYDFEKLVFVSVIYRILYVACLFPNNKKNTSKELNDISTFLYSSHVEGGKVLFLVCSRHSDSVIILFIAVFIALL